MLMKWKLFGQFQQSEALPTEDCRSPQIGLGARAILWLERDDAGHVHKKLSLFHHRGYFFFLSILLGLCFDLSNPKAIEGVTNDHLTRLAALHNVMDLPVDNLSAGEEVHEAVVEVIVGGVVKGDGPLADAAEFAVHGRGIGCQLRAQ